MEEVPQTLTEVNAAWAKAIRNFQYRKALHRTPSPSTDSNSDDCPPSYSWGMEEPGEYEPGEVHDEVGHTVADDSSRSIPPPNNDGTVTESSVYETPSII